MQLNNIISNIKNYIYFNIDKYKNYYPYKLIGESKISTQNSTYVKYKDFGYNAVFEQPIKDLFENKDILYKFHPEDVSKITLIAFGEMFFYKNDETSIKQFEEIKEKIIKSIGGK